MQLTFADLGLSPKVLEAVTASGYVIPTPIQAAAIPIANEGRDVLGIAQTGTGKTAAFVLPMLARLERGRARARMPRSLILAPTRELAAQVEEHFNRFGANHKLTVALLIGGVSFEEQNKKLDRGADVLIATPGRLLDQFQRGKILMTGVEILVIDEADRMLDMGFIPDIERICAMLPPVRQTLFFSATMPPEITRLVERFLKNPERVEVAKQATTASTITQRFLRSPSDPKAKRSILRNLIRSQTIKNAIIFCNRKRDVAIVHKSLERHGFNAGALHGDMDQHHRTATLDGFRGGQITLLAASDVAARGLDIPDVSHVFNYDVPVHSEDYVHRIGRTGRAGREGFSATLVTPEDAKMMRMIEKMVGAESQWLDGIEPDASSLGGESDTGRRRGGRERGARESGGRESGARESAGRERGDRGGRGRERGHRNEVPVADIAAVDDITSMIGQADSEGPAEQPPHVEPAIAARQEDSRRPRSGERSEGGGRRRGGRGPKENGRERTLSVVAETSAEERAPEFGQEQEPPKPRGIRGEGERSRPRGRGRNDEQRPQAAGTLETDSRARPAGADTRREPMPPETSDRPDRRPTQRHDRIHDREPRGGRRDDAPVLGLGDHVPDFLKRPVKIGG